MFWRRYIYVDVRFMNDSKPYAYRTNDATIKANDIVLVPTQKEDNLGTVTAVRKCSKENAPYPPEKTKFVIRKVGRFIRTNLSDVDMRVPFDISTAPKKMFGKERIVVVGQEERDRMRAKHPHLLLVEDFPVSMAGKVVEEDGRILIPRPKHYEDQQGKPAKWILHRHFFSCEYECSYCHSCYDVAFPICPNCRKKMEVKRSQTSVAPTPKTYNKIAYWTEQEHLWGEKTYQCSNCNSLYTEPSPLCPKCKATMTKTKTDPVWIDEMAEYDGE